MRAEMRAASDGPRHRAAGTLAGGRRALSGASEASGQLQVARLRGGRLDGAVRPSAARADHRRARPQGAGDMGAEGYTPKTINNRVPDACGTCIAMLDGSRAPTPADDVEAAAGAESPRCSSRRRCSARWPRI